MRTTRGGKKLDAMIDRLYGALADGVQVRVLDLPLIFRDCRAAASAALPEGPTAVEAALVAAVQAAIIQYRQN